MSLPRQPEFVVRADISDGCLSPAGGGVRKADGGGEPLKAYHTIFSASWPSNTSAGQTSYMSHLANWLHAK
jgi:hypothetical protein